MGYYTSLWGELEYSRPLEEKDVKAILDCHENSALDDTFYEVTNHFNVGDDRWDSNDHDMYGKFSEFDTNFSRVVNVLAKQGIVCNGGISWSGEEDGDSGHMGIEDNVFLATPYKQVPDYERQVCMSDATSLRKLVDKKKADGADPEELARLKLMLVEATMREGEVA